MGIYVRKWRIRAKIINTLNMCRNLMAIVMEYKEPS